MSSPASEAGREGRFLAFTFADYRKYWLARFFATFALQMVVVAVGWQIYDLTRSAFDLGLVGLSQFAPSLLLILVTGAVADRFGRRNLMALSVGVDLLATLALAALTLHGLTSPLPVFGLLVVLGIARAFLGPAAASLVVNLVPEHAFPNAVAWNSSAWQVATILGPVAGGLAYGIAPALPYLAAAVLLGISVACTVLIPRPPKRSAPGAATPGAIFAGFRYIFSQPVVLGAISLDLFAVLLGGAVALMPIFARDILHLGPWGLGLLRASPGIGAVAMAGVLASYPIRDHAGLIMFIGVILFGVFTATFGLSSIAWISILSLAMLGAADMVSVYVRETLIQLWTPDEVRGRVNAVNMLFVGASNELGEMRAGMMASVIGAVPAVVFGGVVAIGVAGLWMVWFPQLRRIRTLTVRDQAG